MATTPHVKMPEYHGDPDKFPGETWKNYRNKLELVYLGMGNSDKITDQQRVAHMLGGLRGKAAKFLEIKPELMNMTPQEVSTIIEKRFGQASIRNLLDLNTIQQKPAESVMEYAARLKTAAEYLQDNLKDVIIVKKEDLDKYDKKKQRVWTQEEFDLKVETVKENLERLLVPFFIDGLRQELKNIMMQKVPMPSTLTEAVEFAEARERHAEAFKDIRSSTISNTEGYSNDILKEAAGQLQFLNMSSTPSPEENQHYRGKERRCLACQEVMLSVKPDTDQHSLKEDLAWLDEAGYPNDVYETPTDSEDDNSYIFSEDELSSEDSGQYDEELPSAEHF
jgi:hypothetical protein